MCRDLKNLQLKYVGTVYMTGRMEKLGTGSSGLPAEGDAFFFFFLNALLF